MSAIDTGVAIIGREKIVRRKPRAREGAGEHQRRGRPQDDRAGHAEEREDEGARDGLEEALVPEQLEVVVEPDEGRRAAGAHGVLVDRHPEGVHQREGDDQEDGDSGGQDHQDVA